MHVLSSGDLSWLYGQEKNPNKNAGTTRIPFVLIACLQHTQRRVCVLCWKLPCMAISRSQMALGRSNSFCAHHTCLQVLFVSTQDAELVKIPCKPQDRAARHLACSKGSKSCNLGPPARTPPSTKKEPAGAGVRRNTPRSGGGGVDRSLTRHHSTATECWLWE